MSVCECKICPVKRERAHSLRSAVFEMVGFRMVPELRTILRESWQILPWERAGLDPAAVTTSLTRMDAAIPILFDYLPSMTCLHSLCSRPFVVVC